MTDTKRPSVDNVIHVDFRTKQRMSATETATGGRSEVGSAGDAATQPASIGELEQLLSTGEGPAALFAEWIESGMVMVTLDARRDGVRVPDHLRDSSQLNLNFSKRFGISDFTYDDEAVSGTLSFGGVPTFCFVPWGAVYVLSSQSREDVRVFVANVPTELAGVLKR